MVRIRPSVVSLCAAVALALSAFAGVTASPGKCTLKLKGVAELPQQRFALLQILERGKTPVAVTLREGVRSGDFELLEMDIRKRVVVIRNGSEVVRLWFEDGASAVPEFGSDPDHVPIPLVPDPNAGDI